MEAKEILDRVRAKMVTSSQSDDALRRTLADIARLQKDLASTGSDGGSESVLRMPYSSMPKLSSRCWK